MKDNATPHRGGREITLGERYEICALLKAGLTQAKIAHQLGRARSTISRELRRGNTDGRSGYTYDPEQAERVHRFAVSKRGRPLKIGKDFRLAALIEHYIKQHRFSPYATLATLRNTNKLSTSICVVTLYNYIRTGVLDIPAAYLLRGFRPRKKEQIAFKDRQESSRRNGGQSISQRPVEILHRREFGHWEGDLVLGKKGHSESVLTLVERKTRKLIAIKLASARQISVIGAFDELEHNLGSYFPLWFKSITFDNGSEFLDVKGIQRSYRIGLDDPGGASKRVGEIYFAHPFCSSERGTNENTNGLLRRRFPKGTDFSQVSSEELQDHVRWINNYPRKIFNGKTAQQMFEREIACL